MGGMGDNGNRKRLEVHFRGLKAKLVHDWEVQDERKGGTRRIPRIFA